MFDVLSSRKLPRRGKQQATYAHPRPPDPLPKRMSTSAPPASQPYGLQRLVWSGQIPVRFDLASNEVTTYQSPRPMFVMVPRLSYFPLLLARVIDYFEKYAPPMLGIESKFDSEPRKERVV